MRMSNVDSPKVCLKCKRDPCECDPTVLEPMPKPKPLPPTGPVTPRVEPEPTPEPTPKPKS